MNIYVGNLNSKTTEEDLKETFGKYGQVDSVKIIKDFETGQPRGFGFVDMSEKDGNQAIKELNETELNGNSIIVNEARERRPRNNSFNGRNNNRRF